MRMRVKRLFVVFLTLAMVITGFIGKGIPIKADTDDNTIYITENKDLIVTPGQTTHISIPIRAKSAYLFIPDITVSAINASDISKFSFTKPTLSVDDKKVNEIKSSTTTNLEFDVTVDDSAEIKSYPIGIKFDYIDYTESTLVTYTYTLTTNIKIQEEKAPAQLTVSGVTLDSSNIGSSTNLKFTVTNEGEITAKNVYLSMDFGTIMAANYITKNIKIGDLTSGTTHEISLPVDILTTAAAGKNSLTANFSYKNSAGDALTSAYVFTVNLISNTKAPNVPNLGVTDMSYGDSLKPGDNFTLTVKFKNSGTGTASNIVADINSSSITQDGIIKNYYTNGITAGNMAKDKTASIKIPLTVSKYATGGMKNVTVDITYTDDAGTKYSASETVYVDVTAATTVAGSPNIVITDVVQSPLQPEAGDKITISFTLENKSKVDATELKIYPDGLTGNTFIPVESDPYEYIEKLAGGEKKKITIPLIISTSIAEGLTNLTIKYSYTGGEGSAIIPVHDIKNDVGSSSIPKLIISQYTTDTDELKAGTTFNLTYDIYNTNSTVAAKNITVTITQADNVFTVTQGSNSFFINKMDPGETSQNTIQMKVKSDATTKAYPITITVEYEYDGIEPNTETGTVGITKTYTLNLNAMENARPVVDNVNVYSWDGAVMVQSSATLSFYFYNMGKSVLNNVMVSVEGDGFTSTGGILYIGNVEAGTSQYEEIEVTPNYEGTATGTLKVSYEDSNGDTVEFTKEFSTDVMPAANIDTGIPDGGSGEVLNPDVTVAKDPILPIWAFVLVQIGIFIIFVPVTRKILISAYRGRLRRKEQEQYKEQA